MLGESVTRGRWWRCAERWEDAAADAAAAPAAQQPFQQQFSTLTSSMVDLTRQVGGVLRPEGQLVGSQSVEGQSLGGQPSTGSHSAEESVRAGSTSGGQSFRADPASRGQSVCVDLVNSGSVNGGPVTSGSFGQVWAQSEDNREDNRLIRQPSSQCEERLHGARRLMAAVQPVRRSRRQVEPRRHRFRLPSLRRRWRVT